MITKEFVKLPLAEIIPYENNPRINDEAVAHVVASIKQCENLDPIEVDEDNVILSGHTRLLALQSLGYTETDCVRFNGLDEEQKRKYRILANKTNEVAAWDFAKLEKELEGLDFDGFDFGFGDLEGLNFSPAADDGGEESEAVEDDYEEELPEEPKSKLGEIYQLGRHRLMCGDSTKVEDVKKLTGGAVMDLLITDPPYNVAYEGKTKDALTIQNDSMDDSSFRNFLRDAYTSADAVMKPGAVFYIWHADSEGYNFRGACRDVDWQVRECLIWVKNSMVLGRQDYQWRHEPCQPAGTMVWTPSGKVPIEELKDGDRVVSFDTFSGCVKGYKEGLEVKTANRHYTGNMYAVQVGNKVTKTTENHQFSVRFNPDTSETYCTYLMRKGKRWRVGITRTYDARGFGLKHRVAQEKADDGWLVSTFKSMADAQMGEQLLSCKYGIPYTYWETQRGLNDEYTHRSEKQIDWLYDQLDADEMQKNAERLLSDAGRSIKYPLVCEKTKAERFSRRSTARINACNLIPDLMQVPIPKEHYDGAETFSWEKIDSVTSEEFDGEVYSLAVDKYEHYVADGIITHNCLYGWKSGASHFWNSDRKQTTLLEFKRPTRAEIHPTMKPIALFDYQIKNSSKQGENVLDLFNGSGTTIMACEQNGRNAFTMELDPRYVDAAIDRWEKFTGQKAVKISEAE